MNKINFDTKLTSQISDRIIKRLKFFPQINDLFNNQYTEDFKGVNLLNYLTGVRDKEFLVIGEAASFRGCMQTGVPFSSKQTLEKFPTNYNWPFKLEGIPEYFRSPTSSIIWDQFMAHDFFPVIWNAFPFNPHSMENRLSNRKPTKKELALSSSFILELIEIFNTKYVFCIGTVAFGICTELLGSNPTIAIHKLKHPSYGGANQFRNDFEALMDLYFPE